LFLTHKNVQKEGGKRTTLDGLKYSLFIFCQVKIKRYMDFSHKA